MIRSVDFSLEDLAVEIMPGLTWPAFGSADLEYSLDDPANRYEVGRIRLYLDGPGSAVLPPDSPHRPAIVKAIAAKADAVNQAIEADRQAFYEWRDAA